MFYLKTELYSKEDGDKTISWSGYKIYKDAYDEMTARHGVFLKKGTNKKETFITDVKSEIHKKNGDYYIFQICKEIDE